MKSTAAKTIRIKRGGVTASVHPTPRGGYDAFTLVFYQDGKRVRKIFPTLELARREGQAVIDSLSRGEIGASSLTGDQRASYLRAMNLLSPCGVSLELAAAEYAGAKKMLGEVPLHQAVAFFLERSPKNIIKKTVLEIYEELCASKRQDGLSEVYLKDLTYRLGRFAKAFQMPLADVQGKDIAEWLGSMEVSPRSRNNYRLVLNMMVNFSKARRYLPKDWEEIETVGKAKEPATEIEIFTPQEMAQLLAAAEPHLLPFVAIGGFAGIRHAEITRLDWQDVNLQTGHIEVRAGNAKTAARRLIPIVPALAQWLRPYHTGKGKVCAYQDMTNELLWLAKQCGIPWKRNGLRHSFISYRVAQTQNMNQVALEAGNSPQMIIRHYRELVTPAEAKRWFGILPAKASNVVPLQVKRVP